MIRDADPKQFLIEWVDAERWPQSRPDPRYPTGKDVQGCPPDVTGCRVAVPYPARRIGAYVIECKLCGLRMGLTTAGRPDDPRSVAMACKTAAAPDPAD
jgi:hypothetical protein